ncbi:methyltransferase domain-containing protein [Thermodesulfobacteriota bacterium]
MNVRIPSYKDIGNAIIYRLRIIFFKIQIFIQHDLKFLKYYEPNPFKNNKERSDIGDQRECKNRLDNILSFIPNRAYSVLDIGCNVGYFTFNYAKLGGFCIGIDYGRNEVMIAKSFAEIHKVPNVAFSQMEISDNNILTLPKVDIVNCLSIYHHWARKFGEDHANSMLEKLCDRCERYFVFDSGQPDEDCVEWANRLNYMLPDVEKYFNKLFNKFGFKEMQNIGKYGTTVSKTKRNLYIAIK